MACLFRVTPWLVVEFVSNESQRQFAGFPMMIHTHRFPPPPKRLFDAFCFVLRFPTPDNSPRLKYDERTRLSSSAAPFQPKSSGANAVNPGTFYVPMGYMNMSQSHMSHSHMSHMNMGYQVNPWWDLPSVGSSQHGTGHCRPCAFLSRGCAKGQACTFCHLCGV